MENNKVEFKKYLKVLVTKMNEINQTDSTKKTLKVFDKLNINKVAKRYFEIINPVYSLVENKDQKLFENKLLIMPNINISEYWTLFDDEFKNKVWSLLNVLFVLSDLIRNNDNKKKKPKEESNSETNTENNEENKLVVKENEEFNPYIGVKSGTNKFSIDELFGGPENLPNDKKKPVLTDAGLMSQVGKLSKMIDMKKFSEDIKNINTDDIKEATNNIKNLLGGNSDEKTSNLISDMLDDILKNYKQMI